ncbi:MAG TPA: TlpA disulfide reductase family protein [Candidatus Competibacteraceae bacterium]|nr:TlpA disulfide reductase family protein [Candidatus Competibacteraceae bacterium]
MKSGLLAIGVTLVGVGLAALLWSRVDQRVEKPRQGDAPAASGGPSTSPSGVRLTTPTASSTASREARAPSAPPVPAASNLDSLFAALAVHRPPEALEAPDFTLLDVEGRPVRLREFRGKLVFLNFWATWCPPCRLEMPSVQRLYQTFNETAFAMLAVSIDRQGVEAVKPFMDELHLTFPALLDQKSEVARQYGLRGLPTTYLIDQDGRLIGAAVGGRDWSSSEAKTLIAGLLRQAATAATDPAPSPSAGGR